jgi:hypothetical protein
MNADETVRTRHNPHLRNKNGAVDRFRQDKRVQAKEPTAK